MSIDNLKLRTKTLIPLVVMALTMVGMVVFAAARLTGVSSAATEMVEKRDAASQKVTRAGKKLFQLGYALDIGVLTDGTTEASKAADSELKTAPAALDTFLSEAADALPEHAQELGKLRERAQAIAKSITASFQEGARLPGVDQGRALKPEELDGLAKVAKDAARIDVELRGLAQDMTAMNDRLRAEVAAGARALADRAHNAIVTLAAAGAAFTILAVAFAFWMTTAKVERPLTRLGDIMRKLAGGDLSVEVAGAERRDEIGGMAQAVQVFKTQGVERARAEQDAAAAREAADAERNRAAAERARSAETQGAAMTALRDGLRRLADGDLLVRLDQGFSAEFADVREDFNAAAGKLKAALAAVVTSTGAIQSSTREISSASDNLSQRTEQQAASLEETAAALEEITTTVKTSAQGAKHASEVAATADADAKNGAVVVRQAVEAMDAIAESSTKIGQIIGVIDEIAFQTNLLALNAGVEAARAGDSGKGFAVVASEVRALAQRSAEAAKEIKVLVSASGAQVEAGVKLVAESGKALQSIIGQVSEINKIVADIANGAQQQATGLQQINAAIGQMDQSTQQNATMVEESTAASHSLSQEMRELTKLVEQFRVGEGGEERLRRDLKAAVPHAFAKPAAAPPARSAKPALREAPRPVAKAASSADWSEF